MDESQMGAMVDRLIEELMDTPSGTQCVFLKSDYGTDCRDITIRFVWGMALSKRGCAVRVHREGDDLYAYTVTVL